MFTRTTTEMDAGWGRFRDVDVNAAGEWVAVFHDLDRLVLRTARRSLVLRGPSHGHVVRWLDDAHCLVLDGWADSEFLDPPTGWIVPLDGSEPSAFRAGERMADVLVGPRHFVITYGEEAVMEGNAPSPEGVAVFDHGGALLAGYSTHFGRAAVEVDDCYAACWVDHARIAFSSYDSFDLVIWDLETNAQEVHPTPEVLHGSEVLTSVGGEFLFWGPYHSQDVVLRWGPGGAPARVAELPRSGSVRCLDHGVFLEKTRHAFSILRCELA